MAYVNPYSYMTNPNSSGFVGSLYNAGNINGNTTASKAQASAASPYVIPSSSSYTTTFPSPATSSYNLPPVATYGGLGVDALNEMAGNPGAASAHYGFSTDANSPYYIFGDKYLGKLQSDWSSGIESGGNKQIVKYLTGLGTSKTGQNQAFVKANPQLGSWFDTYFKTGKIPAGLTPQLADKAYDYVLRATGVDAVKDRSPGLLGGLLKGNLGAIAGTVAGFALPGLGPALGGMIGGGIQGGVNDGFGGAILGGLGGYGLGSGANWLAGKAGLPFAVASSANPAPIINKGVDLGSYTNSLASGPLGTGGISGVVSGGAAAGNLGSVPATWANWGSQAANLPNTFNEFAGLSSASSGGFLSNLSKGISGALNMGNLGTALQAAGLAGGAISAYNYLNPVTGKSQMNDLEQRVAALFGNPDEQYQPYNVTTPLSQVVSDGQNITVNPNQQVMDSFNQYTDLINRAGSAAANVDVAGLSMDFYNQLNALQGLQEADEFRRLESTLFNKAGVHTGTQNMMADFQSRLDAARQSRQFDAINAALAYQGDLYNQFMGLGEGVVDFNAGLFNPYAQQGIQAGSYDATANLKAKDYLANLEVQKASQSYLDDVRERDYFNDALSFGFDFLGGLV